MSVKQKKKPLKFLKKKFNPHKYQWRCVLQGIIKKQLGFFLDPGLGKTGIILMLYKILKKAGLVRGMLVVAPLRPCYMVWPKEVKKWSNFSHLSIAVLHKEWHVGRNTAFKRNHDIYVINPEGLPWLLNNLKGKRREKWPFNMLVVDESTKFKNPSTERFRNIKKIVPKIPYRFILTGTPIPNGLLNIQSQMYIVDLGESLGTKQKEYRDEYFKQVGDPKWKKFEIKAGKEEEIYKRSSKNIIRLKAEDYLDMPEKINNVITVKLPRKARKHYDEIENELFTCIDGNEIDILHAATVGLKCQQVANGRIYKDLDPLMPAVPSSRREVIKLHESKLDALEDLIEELDNKPLLVGYWFKHDLQALRGRFGKNLTDIGSKVSMARCVEIERDWNRGKIPILAAFPGTAALGLNLQECGNDVAFYSMLNDLESYEQFYRRIYRQGMVGRQMRVHHILAENTIDFGIYASLQGKDKRQMKFLDMVQLYASFKVAG